jgi:hypothetical protein
MHMNWLRLLAAFGLPPLVAVPVAVLFWVRRQTDLGTIAGAGVLFIGALVFGGVEYVDGIRFRMWCAQTGTPCASSSPSDFARISAYGVVAMVQTMVLFVVAELVERRREQRRFDPKWRR